MLLLYSCLNPTIRFTRSVQRLQRHRPLVARRCRGSCQRRIMASVQQERKQKPPSMSSLEALDRSLSTAVFRNVGALIPRPALMLFEHAGNGLFWIPGAANSPRGCMVVSECGSS